MHRPDTMTALKRGGAVRRPRVLHISTVHTTTDTRILFRECMSLAVAGYDTALLTCGPRSDEIGGVRLLPLPKPASRLERMTVTAFAAVRAALKYDADIYHFHDPELAPWMLIVRAVGKPVVFDVHENVIGSLADRSWIPSWARPAVSSMATVALRLLMSSFDVVLAEQSYQKVYSWLRESSVVCNFPALDQFPVLGGTTKFARFSMVYVGGLRIERGLLDMLDAMRMLQDQGRDVDLYLIGRLDEPRLGTVEAQIAVRELHNVHFLGYLPQPEAMEVVARCHVGLAVLHAVPNYMESYPTKMFEYMACELPVIVSDFPLYSDVVVGSRCGLTVPPQKPELLANAIGTVAELPDQGRALGRNGRKAVETRYNWGTQEDILLAVYTKAMARSVAVR